MWPDGVDARTFEPGDERVFYDVHQEAFADSLGAHRRDVRAVGASVPHAERSTRRSWPRRRAETSSAGVAICHPHVGDAELGWVASLGVRRPWRGAGSGAALLLRRVRASSSAAGMTRVGLGVDAESPTGANRLYERVGMRVVRSRSRRLREATQE